MTVIPYRRCDFVADLLKTAVDVLDEGAIEEARRWVRLARRVDESGHSQDIICEVVQW